MTKTVCTSRPDCPCDFCTRIRVELKGKKPRKHEIDALALAHIRAYEEWYDRQMDLETFGTVEPLPKYFN